MIYDFLPLLPNGTIRSLAVHLDPVPHTADQERKGHSLPAEVESILPEFVDRDQRLRAFQLGGYTDNDPRLNIIKGSRDSNAAVGPGSIAMLGLPCGMKRTGCRAMRASVSKDVLIEGKAREMALENGIAVA